MAAFQGPEEDFIGASIYVNVTVFSSGAALTHGPQLSSGHCVPSQPRHSAHVTSGGLLPAFPHERNGEMSEGWQELNLCYCLSLSSSLTCASHACRPATPPRN